MIMGDITIGSRKYAKAYLLVSEDRGITICWKGRPVIHKMWPASYVQEENTYMRDYILMRGVKGSSFW